MWTGEWAQGRLSRTAFLLFPPTVPRRILVAGASAARRPPPPDFSSVFLLSARRGHLRGGPAGGGTPASAAPHSQGSPGAACQQVSMVKGPGKRPRARPAGWAAIWEFPAPEEDIRGSPLRAKPWRRGQVWICEPGISLLCKQTCLAVLAEKASLPHTVSFCVFLTGLLHFSGPFKTFLERNKIHFFSFILILEQLKTELEIDTKAGEG